MEEIWKPVKDYEDSYEVSSLGRVRSIDRTIVRSDGHKAFLHSVLLKPAINPRGYLIVRLCKEGKGTPRTVHRIVMEAFVSKRPNGLEVNHKNGDKTDNKLSNLEYITPSENVSHAYLCIKRKASGQGVCGANNPKSKEYLITTPEGEQFVIKGLNKFCKDNKLSTSNMHSVATGKMSHSKGWRCSFV